MASSSIHQPHDKLFRKALQQRESVLDFLEHHAPAELLEALDLATLDLKPDTFVSEEYKNLESDVIYGVHTKHGEGYLYFLLEHQTQEDRYIPVRLMEYSAQIMRLHLHQHEAAVKLPEVYTLVLYAGDDPYRGARSLREAFMQSNTWQRMGEHVYLIDLVRITNAELKKHGKVAITELTLKEGRKDPRRFFREHIGLINGSNISGFVILYLASFLSGKEEREEFLKEVSILSPKNKDFVMIGFQEIRDEGIQQGIQQGMQQGMHERELDIAYKMRARGMDLTLIRELTGVDPKELELRKK